MENNNNSGAEPFEESGKEVKSKQTVPLSRRALLEFYDIMAGVAFPFIVMLVISSTVILFASFSGDIGISLVALIGGEIMMIAALIAFGRANGNAAYAKTVLNNQKRGLGSTDEKVLAKTGEYSLWKGILIGAILCIPFLIVQIIELCYDNSVCTFCLQYMFGWAYYPFSYLGKDYQALNLIMIILPIGTHALGYFLGKLKQIKIQQAVAEKNANKKGRRK